jgi:uncharacterized protein (TIGR00369 family)
MPENEHRNCLLCGDLHPNSFGLRFTPNEDGTVHATFQSYEELQGYDGILHGGIIASLLDSAMTNCLFRQGIRAVTADLRILYKHSVPCGAKLDVKAWLDKSHPPLHCLSAELSHNNRIMAHGEAKFMECTK